MPEEELDLEFLAFCKRCVTSTVKWDILLLFARNPYIQDTPQGLAHRIGRSPNIVRIELEDLSLLGILEAIPFHEQVGSLSPTAYRLTSKPALRRLVFQFAAMADYPA